MSALCLQISCRDPTTSAQATMEKTMMISTLDQILFSLACKHTVVLGRLRGRQDWTCGECQKRTDLNAEPFKAELAHDLDTAEQIDLQEKAKGNTVTPAD
jgi:hypothetical protein